MYKAHAHRGVVDNILHADGRGDMGDKQIFFTEGFEDLLGRHIGLTLCVHRRQSAEHGFINTGGNCGGDHGVSLWGRLLTAAHYFSF